MPGRVVDFHAHVTPVRFREAIRDRGEWYGLESSTGELEVAGFRRTLEERLADMDSGGVDVQLVSPNAGFYQYDNDPTVALAVARDCNDEIAEMRDAHPTRFEGMATLPMQDVPLAMRELERVMTERRFKGVMVGDHVNGRTWDEPEFAPFWAAVESLGAIVFFHQGSGTVVSSRISRYHLDNSVGNLTERALTFGALVGGGIIDRHPNLKLVLGHAGGFTAFASARMDRAWRAGRSLTEEGVDPAIALGGERGAAAGGGTPAEVESAAFDWNQTSDRHAWSDAGKWRGTPGPPSEYLRSFHFDCCTYTAGTLRFLIDTVGADRIVLGTDYPAPMILDNAVSWIRGLDAVSEAEAEQILSGTAATLLG
jgi:aminocarboxymuconate-semialdehyde decarboxylase